MELNFGIDADAVQVPVAATAATSILLLEPPVCVYFQPLYLFSTFFFKFPLVSLVYVLYFAKLVRDNLIRVPANPQVSFLFSS